MGTAWRWHRDGRKNIDIGDFGITVPLCCDPRARRDEDGENEVGAIRGRIGGSGAKLGCGDSWKGRPTVKSRPSPDGERERMS